MQVNSHQNHALSHGLIAEIAAEDDNFPRREIARRLERKKKQTVGILIGNHCTTKQFPSNVRKGGKTGQNKKEWRKMR
jgi:hypothetical protein